MTSIRLILRNLRHFRWANLAVIAGMAVATAVLTGALMVGDSVRGSLRDLTARRLGPVDHALVATRFFPQSLARRIAEHPDFAKSFKACEPAIVMQGGARGERPPATLPSVQIAAAERWVAVERGKCVVNREVADGLDLQPDSPVVLSLPSVDPSPRDSALGRRSRQETTAALRVRPARTVESGMEALFSLGGTQRTPRNIWVNLVELQQAVDAHAQANVLLVEGDSATPAAAKLNAILRDAVTLEDYGLKVAGGQLSVVSSQLPVASQGENPIQNSQSAILSSESTYLAPAVEAAAQKAAEDCSITASGVLTYLVNRITVQGPQGTGKSIHYAVAAGISDLPQGALADEECAINQWTADQLGAKVGDTLAIAYYQRQSNGELGEIAGPRGSAVTFRIRHILPMSGLGADNSLTPNYKGLTDARSVRDWQEPEGLKIDRKLITQADEDYWKKHRAAPKLLISLKTAQRLWGEAFGGLTSIRVPADKADAFAAALRRHIDPAGMGLSFTPIKSQQLEAASGGTDFSELFVGFSFFLIASAAMLLAMLLRLSVEQRARQWGLLAALGFTPRTLRRLALGEGMLLSLIGGLVGLAGAVGYTALMVHGLRTWWVGAVGTTAMRLYISPVTLALGLVCALVISLLAILWSLRRLSRSAPASLLGGAWAVSLPTRKRHRVALWIGAASALVGAAMVLLGAIGALSDQIAFMAGGFLLLTAATSLIGRRLAAPVHRRLRLVGSWAMERIGAGNAARHPARSLLTVSLIALATFILITVASMKQGRPQDTHQRTSGAGGFALILQADIPLDWDIASPQGRGRLGIRTPADDSPTWTRSTFISMRRWAGQDISCLNLTRPTQPTILAVPPALIERGGFAPAGRNPLALLKETPADGAVNVLADAETAQYILKLSVGQTLSITDQLGRPQKLRLAGTLSHSIFQSELLMAESDFVRLFPLQSGFGVVLIDAGAEDARLLKRTLPGELEDYSANVDHTADRLARFAEVADTYLSTFQALGALGLMLGSIGLAVVLLRSLVERKSELSLLSALGFSPGARLRLVLSENAMLLLIGLLTGGACALVAVLPAVLGGRPINWPSLALMLGLVLLIGLTALTSTVLVGARHLRPADLRGE